MDLLSQIKRDEGTGPRDSSGNFKPYRDTVGKLTIGYGHNLDDNGINQKVADFILADDLEAHAAQLHFYLPWTDSLDEVRRAVLINMAFNMGIHGLLKFKNTLEAIHDGEYQKAALMMLQSKWADQVGIRAKRLADQMATGEWR